MYVVVLVLQGNTPPCVLVAFANSEDILPTLLLLTLKNPNKPNPITHNLDCCQSNVGLTVIVHT